MKVQRLCLGLLVAGAVLSGPAAMATSAGATTTAIERPLSVSDVQRFSAALSHIKSFYVKPVTDQELFDDAIRGMLKGLDPHSNYLDADAFKDIQTTTTGEYGGLGIEITTEDKFIKVVSPIDDTPAARAGVKAGDVIIKLDDKSVNDMNLRTAVKHMRGKAGTEIRLTILRKKAKNNPLVITLKRERIQINTVKSDLIDQHYGYVRVSHFQAPTGDTLTKKVMALQKQSGSRLKGLVLDLRNNPGGLLDSAVHVSDAFIHNDNKGPEEVIVSTKGRVSGTNFIAHATPGDLLKGAPIVVLINEGSASGSEIVAGALQDHGRAVVMGKKSFGKGSVQTILPLDEKHGVKLTTALYYTPTGRSIQAKGIVPDVVIENLRLADVEKTSGVMSLSEADLKGHIENGEAAAKKTAKRVLPEEKTLAEKDYQLYQAIVLLKGLNVLQQQAVS